MSGARRFSGAAVALGLLLGVGALWWSVQGDPRSAAGPPGIFAFEKEEVVGFRVIRPADSLAFERRDGVWHTEGQSWAPSATMVRRVAHQLHDLSARAVVAPAGADPDRYGLGSDAIRVELDLEDGRRLAFAVGDPNPTSVSWYVRPLPDGPVFVVKKAAVDYFRLDAERFREDRIASFDAADCEGIEAVVDGRRLVFERVDAARWRMVEPVAWPASRDQVRRILGAVASARASSFVADQPADPGQWGIGEDSDRVALSLVSAQSITVRLGDPIEGSDPPERMLWRAEHDAVYAVRSAILEPLRQPLVAYRDPMVLGGRGRMARRVVVERLEQVVVVERSADDWRWEDGAPIPGATPRRLVEAAELRALGFHDSPPADPGLDPPWARLTLESEDGEAVQITLGRRMQVVGEAGRTEGRQLARVGEGPLVVEVSDALAQRVEDLIRERSRRLERQGERTTTPPPTP